MARYEELRYRLDLLQDSSNGRFAVAPLGKIDRDGKHYDIIRLDLRGHAATPIEVCLAFGTHGNEDWSAESVYEFSQSLVDPGYVHPHITLPSGEEREVLLGRVALTTYFFNPVGFDRNERTNGERLDLNRWFGREDPPPEVALVVRDLAHRHFDALIDLHGDIEGNGFLIYERTRLNHSIARETIEFMSSHGVRIAPDGDNGGEVVVGGVIEAPPFVHAFDDYLFFEKDVPVTLTFEYPGSRGAAADIENMITGLYGALGLLVAERPARPTTSL